MNGDTEMPTFLSDLTKAVDTGYVVSLLVNKAFNENKVCHKNQLKPSQNCCFIIKKSSSNHEKDVFSDDMGRWERSKQNH